MDREEFLHQCQQTRSTMVKMFIQSGGGHLPSALSLVEILVSLFFSEMNRGPAVRDRFILSKGHGCLALYAILQRLGELSEEECRNIGSYGSRLGRHPAADRVPGIEVSSGSLGLGPSVAVGLALAALRRGLEHRVFCVLGDGECNEGSVWEAALAAGHRRLARLYFLIDANGYQANGKTSDVCDLEPFRGKWEAFGFSCHELNLKDDPAALLELFRSGSLNTDRPKAIVCRTSKDAGVTFLKNSPSWHHKTKITAEEKEKLMREFSL